MRRRIKSLERSIKIYKNNKIKMMNSEEFLKKYRKIRNKAIMNELTFFVLKYF